MCPAVLLQQASSFYAATQRTSPQRDRVAVEQLNVLTRVWSMKIRGPRDHVNMCIDIAYNM